MSKKVELERLAHPSAAAEHLGQRLFDGSLSLLLGAGVSDPLGLPGFRKLIDSALTTLGEPPFVGDDLELGATRLQTACLKKGVDIRSIVKDALYPDAGELPPAKLMGSTRLGALGAMLMGSRRGSVNTVLTLNFDSLIEEYLLLHGYIVNSVTELPALIGSEDVTIFHLHGYLPSKTGPGRDSNKITLTKQSVLEMLGDPNHPWRVILRHVVRSKVLLLLGISEHTAIGDALGSILAYEATHISDHRPSAFWLTAEVKPAALEDFRNVLLDSNVVPVALGRFDEIDEFLLSVCRNAAKQMPYVTV